jgi:hypothetical protein
MESGITYVSIIGIPFHLSRASRKDFLMKHQTYAKPIRRHWVFMAFYGT